MRLNSHNRMWMITKTLIVLGMMSLSPFGCAPTSTGKGGSMNGALTEYNSHNYDQAHDQAAAVAAKSTGTQRERAAYIAGLSAYQAGDADAADSQLSIASVSSDAAIAGSAKAMLGQLRLDQRRPREAAGYFSDASRLLEGEDARQAAWHAGLAYRQAGDEASAKRWLDTASGSQFDQPKQAGAVAFNPQPANSRTAMARNGTIKTSSATPPAQTNAPKVQIQSTGETTVGFTLQVGVFSDKNRAKSAAEEAESFAKKEGIGRVKIIPRRDIRGQPLYMVQVGWWVTRTEANAARNKIGRLEYIVAPAPAE